MSNEIQEQITNRRTIRRFLQTPLKQAALLRWVNAGRLAPSAANRQPLEYILIEEKELQERIFPCLKWAGYIAPAGTPAEGQRPVAYIVVLLNQEIREKGHEYDVGAAMENMILAALSEGVGSCWHSAIDREQLATVLQLPEKRAICSVLSLGFPDESPQAVEEAGTIKYWKDEKGELQIPKRKLEDILFTGQYKPFY